MNLVVIERLPCVIRRRISRLVNRTYAACVRKNFPVRYLSNADGDRYALVSPTDANMTGWKIEVGIDESWRGHQHGISEYDRRIDVEEFKKNMSFGLSEKPRSAMVDWGRKIVRWIPPGGS